MARGMRLMLDNPYLRPVPGNPRSSGGQAGDEAKQFPRDLPGDVRGYPPGDAVLPARTRQQALDSGRATSCAVTGRSAKASVLEHVIPVRMRRKPATAAWPASD